MSAEETVTISKSELDRYKEIEKFALWYTERNGINTLLRREFPNLAIWMNETKDRVQREAQQRKLDKRAEAILPLIGSLPNAKEVACNIILAMSSNKNEFSLLMPKVENQQVDEDNEEEEDWDDDDC